MSSKKATLETRNTLYISLYVAEDGSAGGVISLRKENGDVEMDVGQAFGEDVWRVLDQMLVDAVLLAAEHVIVFSNVELRPFEAPEPDKTEKIWWQEGKGRGNGQYLYVPYGGNADQWNVMLRLTRYAMQGGSWQIVQVDEEALRRAKEQWQQLHK